MLTFINYALLLAGYSATILAFFRESTRARPDKTTKDLTAAGWVTVALVVISVGLAVAKQSLINQKDKQNEAAIQREKDNAASEKKEDDSDKAQLSKQLAVANERIESLKALDSNTNKTLVITRAELKDENLASVVNAFASGNQTIATVAFYLPLTADASRSAAFEEVLRPKFTKRECEDLTAVSVNLVTRNDDYEQFYYYPKDTGYLGGDGDRYHHDFKEDYPKADALLRARNKSEQAILDNILAETKQKSSNGWLYTAAVRTISHHLTVAQLYTHLVKGNGVAVQLSMEWPTSFRNKPEFDESQKKYSRLFKKVHQERFGDTDINIDIGDMPPYPDSCSGEMHRYLRGAFQRAFLAVIVDNPQQETVLFRLKALPPKVEKQLWYVNFVVDGPPEFVATDEEWRGLDPYRQDIDWPDIKKGSGK